MRLIPENARRYGAAVETPSHFAPRKKYPGQILGRKFWRKGGGRRSVIRVKFAVTIPRVGGQPGPVSKEGGGPPRVKAAAALRKERTRVKGSWKVTYGGYMP